MLDPRVPREETGPIKPYRFAVRDGIVSQECSDQGEGEYAKDDKHKEEWEQLALQFHFVPQC